jgi:hypothetical protein
MLDATPRPTFVPIWLACRCGHAWDDWQPSHVPIDTWIAHIKTLHCPACGAGYKSRMLLLRDKPLPDA